MPRPAAWRMIPARTSAIPEVVMKAGGKKQLQTDPGSLRFGQRVTLEVPVRLGVAARQLGRGTIRNASISGALIETSLELPLHSNLIVTLTLPDGDAAVTRELRACVRRIDPAGIGIEWQDMGSVDISDLLARASNNFITNT
jgi:hypothetical protein